MRQFALPLRLNKQAWLVSLVFLGVFGALGIQLERGSTAQTPTLTVEAENGVITGGAVTTDDSGASSGKGVQFGMGTASMLQSLKLLNYYPSQHSWTRMWTEYPRTEIDSDFATMQSMGANSVRIIIQAGTFGYPTPTATMQAHLADMVDLAQAHGLKVQLTLFDFFSSYTDVSGSTAWADAVLAPYKNDPRIAFVELQNELNPTNDAAVSWMQHMLPVLQQDAGNVPVTVSVTNTKNLKTNAGMTVAQSFAILIPELRSTPVDFYDVHYYSGQGPANLILGQVRSEAGTTPVFIGETGISSWDGTTVTNPTQEMRQDMGLRAIAMVARQYGFGMPAIWAFQDFPAGQGGNSQAAGTYSAENFFGLLRADGSWKAAADSLQSIYQTGNISTDYNSDFTRTVGGQVDDWFAGDSTDGTLSWDGTTGHTANGSLALSATGTPTGKVPNFSTIPVANLVNDNQTVAIRAWAKTSAATGTNVVAIDWFSGSKTYLSSTSSVSVNGTNGWTQLTASAIPPAGAAYFQLAVKSAGNSGTVWFDDIQYTVQ